MTWGGKREGAGRPPTGRKRRTLYLTEREFRSIKEVVEKMRAKEESFFETDTYSIDRGYTIHISRAPEFATEAVVEDADGQRTLIDVSHHRDWEDFEDFLDVIVEEYEKEEEK